MYIFCPGKEISQVTSARLCRWALILKTYKFQIRGKRTHEIPHADCMSRLPADEVTVVEAQPGLFSDASELVNRNKIAEETAKDGQLQQLRQRLRSGVGNYPKEYAGALRSLTFEEGCIFNGRKVVAPRVLTGHSAKFARRSSQELQQ